MDEDMQAVGPVLQNEVGTAAHNHARTLVCKVADDIRLADIELIGDGHCVDQAHRMGRDGDVEQKAARHCGVFADLFDEFVREAALLRDRIDQFLIIVGNSKSLCNGLADGAAAAAKLTADGDNFVGHMDSPFSWWLHYTPISRN